MQRNRYNLEVLLSIAELQRFTQQAVLGLARTEGYLVQAGELAASDPSGAVRQMVEAYNLVEGILSAQETMWNDLTAVWEKSRFPRNRTVEGREFVWVMDDVKDHFADRRRGLDYMLAPFQRMEIPAWHDELLDRIKSFAQANGVAVDAVASETSTLLDCRVLWEAAALHVHTSAPILHAPADPPPPFRPPRGDSSSAAHQASHAA